MPSSHLILCHPLLLLPPIPPSITVFPNESTLRIRWPKYWSFSFSIIPSKEIPGLISFRMDWLDLSNEFIYSPMNPKNVCRLWRPHQTYTHNLHFKITELARRFNPETVLRQNTLLLYNPKGCREGKKVCPSFLLENSRPFSPWGPLDFLSTCLGNDSLIPPFSFRRIMLPREKGHCSRSITASELTRGIVPKLVRRHIFLILILRISDPGAPNSSWRKL